MTKPLKFAALGTEHRHITRNVFERLTAESGAAPYAPATDTSTFTARNPSDQAKIDKVVASVSVARAGFESFFAARASQISGKEHRAVTIDDGRRSIELVASMYQAAREGNTVWQPLDKSAPLNTGLAPKSGGIKHGKEMSK